MSLPLQVVSGYKSSSVIRLAFTGGEVDGAAVCRDTWDAERRVEVLRKIFMDTMSDPEFGAELKKAKLDLIRSTAQPWKTTSKSYSDLIKR